MTGAKRLVLALTVVLALVHVLIAGSAAFAASGNERQPWSEAPSTRTITADEAAALTGAPAERIRVLWSTDYSTDSYPALVKLRLYGLDGLPVYVFAFVDGAWRLAAEGVGPEVDVPVNGDGPLSAAVLAPAAGGEGRADRDIRGTTEESENASQVWLPYVLAATVYGTGLALIAAHRKKQ